MNNKTAISLHNVSKSFSRELSLRNLCKIISKKNSDNDLILSNISMEINKGDFVTLVGKNGSGKSTLLKLISGVLKPDSGIIQVNGKINAIHELTSGFNQELNGYENLKLLACLKGIPKKEFTAKLKDVISFSELTEKDLNKPIKYYSSGMKTRLAYSFNITFVKDILLLDEVLAVGDYKFVQKCISRLRYLKEKGVTIVLVTHQISRVEKLITKLYEIENNNLKQISLGVYNKRFNTKRQKIILLPQNKNIIINSLTAKSNNFKLNILQKNTVKTPLAEIIINKKENIAFNFEVINKSKPTCIKFCTIIYSKHTPIINYESKELNLEKSQCTVSFDIDIPVLSKGNYILQLFMYSVQLNTKIIQIELDLISYLSHRQQKPSILKTNIPITKKTK